MSGIFEPGLLPDGEKRELCETLLREFGVTRWRSTDSGEMIHSCPIPGGHRNGDRNPSASLNYKKLTFNCLGCGSKGGLLWWMATCRGTGAEEVREWLSGATGTGGHTMELGRLMEILDALEAPEAKPEPIPNYAASILAPWTGWDHQHPYLTETGWIAGLETYGRACPPETLDRFGIGYCDEYFDKTERIIIPLYWRGKLVGWQARRIAPWDEPKYKFSPSFPRDRTLYNYHSDPALAVVVESPLSVLRHAHHLPQICSTFGAEVTETQIRLLHRYNNVLLWFDNDDAGWKATQQVGRELQSFCDVWAVESPWDADPAELDDRTTEELTARAVPFSVWEPPTELLPWERN